MEEDCVIEEMMTEKRKRIKRKRERNKRGEKELLCIKKRTL